MIFNLHVLRSDSCASNERRRHILRRFALSSDTEHSRDQAISDSLRLARACSFCFSDIDGGPPFRPKGLQTLSARENAGPLNVTWLTVSAPAS
jgi:hypothetical protein